MIKFKPLEFKDLETVKEWRNASMPYTREYRLLNQKDQEAWFESYQKQRRDSDWGQEIMLICDDKEPVAVGGFTRIQWKNRRAELTCCFRFRAEKKLVIDILRALIEKGFDDFGFHKITWPVYEHDSNLELYLRHDEIFKKEATLKEEYFWNGKFWDRYYLSVIKNKKEG